jgi:hypothetical protein
MRLHHASARLALKLLPAAVCRSGVSSRQPKINIKIKEARKLPALGAATAVPIAASSSAR